MRRIYYLLGILACVALTWFGGPVLGRRLSYFNVRRIEVRGARFLAAEEVVRALALPRQWSLFDDRDPLIERVRAMGGVERAEIRRRLPGTLIIELAETPPVAFVGARQGLRMVDERGKLLPYDPARSAPDLPVLERRDSLVTLLLGRMRQLDPALFAEVSAARRVNRDVVVEVEAGRRIWFRPDAGTAEMEAVQLVAQDLARRGRAYKELDARFADQIVVRRSAA